MKVLVVNCSPVKTGATAEIIKYVTTYLEGDFDVKSICIDDYEIQFCKGCRSCHKTAKCIQHDDVTRIMKEFEQADSLTPLLGLVK